MQELIDKLLSTEGYQSGDIFIVDEIKKIRSDIGEELFLQKAYECLKTQKDANRLGSYINLRKIGSNEFN